MSDILTTNDLIPGMKFRLGYDKGVWITMIAIKKLKNGWKCKTTDNLIEIVDFGIIIKPCKK